MDKSKLLDQARNFATLTQFGVEQIKKTALDSRLKKCNILLASPYTRALQSAAIISLETGLDINVEIDLHERKFIPELNRGENNEEMKKRILGVIEKYKNYDNIVVVCHGMLMASIVPRESIQNGEVLEFDY